MNISKKELREKILLSRKLLLEEEIKEKGEKIKNLFFSLPFINESENFFIYISDNRGEVETRSIIDILFDMEKKVWIPRADDFNLVWHLIDRGRTQKLKINSWGIEEPLMSWEPFTEKVPEKTVCVVPGIVFDRRGYRIGYGKGFFDRFLNKNQRCISVGLCYRFQMVLLCPRRGWDVPVDWIITEENIFHPLNSPS